MFVCVMLASLWRRAGPSDVRDGRETRDAHDAHDTHTANEQGVRDDGDSDDARDVRSTEESLVQNRVAVDGSESNATRPSDAADDDSEATSVASSAGDSDLEDSWEEEGNVGVSVSEV